MNSVSDAVYAVTGGARGFGFSITRVLLDKGASVGIIAKNEDSIENALEELNADCVFGVTADVSDPLAIHEALAVISDHFGAFDGLICNAGLARPSPIAMLDSNDVRLQIETNLLGTIFSCQAAIPLLSRSSNPRLITISSASAFHSDEMSHLSVYAATKAAVERFTRDLREELQGDGIGVSCIRPGGAVTGFADQWDPDAFSDAFEAWRDHGEYMDTGMTVTEVANAVWYCLNQPVGTAVDLLEIRPNQRVSKSVF